MEFNLAPDAFVRAALLREGTPEAADIVRRWSHPSDAGESARDRSLLARAMLRCLLVEATGASASGWSFAVEKSGRPIAHCEQVIEPPSVSLSHSGGWVACALSGSGGVGIDVEARRLDRDFLGISKAAFGPREQEAVEKGGAETFYRIWTLREAMAKAFGTGLAFVTDGRDRVANAEVPGWYSIDGARWWLAHSNPEPGMNLALALMPASR